MCKKTCLNLANHELDAGRIQQALGVFTRVAKMIGPSEIIVDKTESEPEKITHEKAGIKSIQAKAYQQLLSYY